MTLDCAKSGVTIDPELRRRVEELLGPGSFRLVGTAPRSATAATRPNNRRRAMAEADCRWIAIRSRYRGLLY